MMNWSESNSEPEPVLRTLRQLYLNHQGAAATDQLHQLTIDQLIAALREVGIAHSRSHGRPKALEKAARYIVRGKIR